MDDNRSKANFLLQDLKRCIEANEDTAWDWYMKFKTPIALVTSDDFQAKILAGTLMYSLFKYDIEKHPNYKGTKS